MPFGIFSISSFDWNSAEQLTNRMSLGVIAKREYTENGSIGKTDGAPRPSFLRLSNEIRAQTGRFPILAMTSWKKMENVPSAPKFGTSLWIFLSTAVARNFRLRRSFPLKRL
jgi:hypothetical protein